MTIHWRISNTLAELEGLTIYENGVLFQYSLHWQQDGTEGYLSTRFLARKLGCSIDAVNVAKRGLRQKGFIEPIGSTRGGRTIARYDLCRKYAFIPESSNSNGNHPASKRPVSTHMQRSNGGAPGNGDSSHSVITREPWEAYYTPLKNPEDDAINRRRVKPIIEEMLRQEAASTGGNNGNG